MKAKAMESVGKQTGAVVERLRTNGAKPPSLGVLPSGALTLRDDNDGQKVLAVMLHQCFQTLRIYGKEPEVLESVVAMFRLVLADYPMEKIIDGFGVWLKRSNEMPAPADIANIIERGGKPPFECAVYVNLSRKPAEQRTSEEWAYMRDYEAAAI